MSTTDSIERELDAELEAPRRHRRRWMLWLTLGLVVAGGAGAAYWFVLRDDGSSDTADQSTGPAATAEVTRETLADTETMGGTLGHGDPFTVTASGQGTITGVAEPDSKVRRGTELYRLNEQPVTAMIGAIPMYRDLKSGDTGTDVKQLEQNLRKLGYGGFTVDDEFTYVTELAVEEWQEDIGIEETGTVRAADVVFLPEAGRVDNVHTDVGAAISPGTEVLDITGSEQVVSLEVEVEDSDLVEVGTDVSVTLPSGKDVKGTVTAATVTEQSSGGDGAGGDDEAAGSDDAVTEVEVTLNKGVDESLIGSPVDVVVKVDEKKDVLVVPVNALLALSEGGYGLEVVSKDDAAAASSSIVPVETGLFADGKVEVSGSGIDEGTVVGVAGR